MPSPSRALPSTSIPARLVSLVGIGLLWCVLAQPHDAHAKKRTGHKASVSQTAHGKGGSKAAPSRSSSEETRAERERRLLRECRGMHDAGACKGYTRGRG